MVIEHKHFDEKIKEAFSGFEVRPPAKVWYGISEGTSNPAPRRLLPLFFRIAAGFALLLVASFTIWYFGFMTVNPDQVTAEAQPTISNASQIAATLEKGISEANSFSDHPGLIRPSSPHFQSLAIQQAVSFADAADLNPLSPLFASINTPAPVLLEFTGSEPPPAISSAGKHMSIAFNSNAGSKSIFSVGIHVAPQYGFRRLPASDMFAFSGIPFKSLEQALISYNAGLSLDFKVSPRLGIRTGVNYSVLGQFILDVFGFSNPDQTPLFALYDNQKYGHPQTIITSQGYIRLSEPSLFFADSRSYRVITNKQFFADGDPANLLMRDYGLSQYFTFVELPLLFHYKMFETRRAEICLKAGGSLNYLIENEVFLGRKSMQRPIGETYGLRPMNFSVSGGVIFNVPIGKDFYIRFEPTAQIYLMPMVHDHQMIGRAIPFQYSLFSGIGYRF